MRGLMHRIAPILRLTRITGAAAAVGNVWFVILWSRAHAAHEPGTQAVHAAPLALLLAGGVLVSLGLFAFGTTLNDLLDFRRDRALRPERPLPSGRVGAEVAVAVVVGTLLASILGSTVFGTGAVLLTLLVAAAILIFNLMGKFIPALGLVVLGLIYAGHMVIPNVRLVFVWPVWLVMTHALVVAAATYTMAKKTPPISRRAVVAALCGWVFWSGVLALIAWDRAGEGEGLWPSWVDPEAALWPAVLIAVFALLSWRRVQQFGAGPRAAEKIARYGALWPVLYGCGWLMGAGRTGGAAVMFTVAVIGYLGMSFLREVYGLVEHPIGYRR